MLPFRFRVELYVRPDQSRPYQDWFDQLDQHASLKVTAAEFRMQQGNLSSIKWFGGIGEYKIDWGPGYRIYLYQDGHSLIVLFGGGTKGDQSKEIDKAKDLLNEYKRRK